MMKKHKMDVLLFLQETHINTNTEEVHDNYIFNFSTSITDQQREDGTKAREQARQSKGRGRNNGKNALALYNLDAEKLGTAVVYTHEVNQVKLDLVQHDNRNITLSLRSKGGRLNITGTHAPHAAKPQQDKESYYKFLRSIARTFGKHKQHIIIVGGFNTKLLRRLPEESEHIGPWIFNENELDIGDLPGPQLENRDMFTEFCLEEDYVVASTWFQTSTQKLITFRYPTAKTFDPPLTHTKFAQLDYILIKKQWRNALRNIDTTPHTSIESDHKLLTGMIQIKLATKSTHRAPQIPKYRTPTSAQRVQYNAYIHLKLNSERITNRQGPLTLLAQVLKESAKKNLTQIPHPFSQPKISRWN